jgi:hypothetical protein
MPIIKAHQIREKLTFVCHHSLAEGYLNRTNVKMSPVVKEANKPEGYWISVDYSWEEFCRHQPQGRLDEHLQLDVVLRETARIFKIDRMEDLKELTDLIGKPALYFETASTLKHEMLNIFEDARHKGIDGIYLSQPHKLRDILNWDISSIVMFNKDDVKYHRKSDANAEEFAKKIINLSFLFNWNSRAGFSFFKKNKPKASINKRTKIR